MNENKVNSASKEMRRCLDSSEDWDRPWQMLPCSNSPSTILSLIKQTLHTYSLLYSENCATSCLCSFPIHFTCLPLSLPLCEPALSPPGCCLGHWGGKGGVWLPPSRRPSSCPSQRQCAPTSEGGDPEFPSLPSLPLSAPAHLLSTSFAPGHSAGGCSLKADGVLPFGWLVFLSGGAKCSCSHLPQKRLSF